MRIAAHPSGRARCGAGAGCSAIKYHSHPFNEEQKITEAELGDLGEVLFEKFFDALLVLVVNGRVLQLVLILTPNKPRDNSLITSRTAVLRRQPVGRCKRGRM